MGEICDKLASLIIEGKNALRDIYSIGLKTLISDVPEEMGPLVVEKLPMKMLYGIKNSSTDEVRRECLDNMNDLIKRFGHLISKEHESITDGVVELLESNTPIICKKAATCLGSIAVVSNDVLLNRLIVIILKKIEEGKSNLQKKSGKVDIRTLIQTVGAISRTVGYRLGSHLESIIPLFLKFCGDSDDESTNNEKSNELRETCFPGLESFILRCPKEVITKYVTDILKASISFMKYDPNYSYDDDDAMDTDNNEEEEYEDAEAYEGSDDDDTSWKVRKAAVKVISAIIVSRPELLEYIYINYAEMLISRFKEREENVRLDVIACFCTLLQVTLTSTKTYNIPQSQASKNMCQRMVLIDHLKKRVPYIIKSSIAQLQGKSVLTKSAVLAMLRSLMNLLQGGLDDSLKSLINSIESCVIKNNQQTLKLDALLFLRSAFELHSLTSLQGILPKSLTLVLTAVNDDWYKIIAEALRVLSSVINVMRPVESISNTYMDSSIPDVKHMVGMMYDCLITRLEANDVDQEIKECAIVAAGKLFSTFGDMLTDKLPHVLGLLCRKLDNEATRIITLKALISIADSTLHLDLSCLTTTAFVGELLLFLRQQNRLLKQTTLQAIEVFILKHSDSVSNDAVAAILKELCTSISDNDLYLNQLAVKIAHSTFSKYPVMATEQIRDKSSRIYAILIELAASSLSQTVTIQHLATFFHSLVHSNLSDAKLGVSFKELFDSLYGRVSQGSSSNGSVHTKEVTKNGIINLSKCIVAISLESQLRATAIDQLVALLSQLNDEKEKQLILLSIGELGQQIDVVAVSPKVDFEGILLAFFEHSQVEDTKNAATSALGHLAVGNMDAFLPVILRHSSSTKQQHLLLSSLKEAIVTYSSRKLELSTSYLDSIVNELSRYFNAEEEGLRMMVAECMGTLLSAYTFKIAPVLYSLNADGDKTASWTIVSSLRHALSLETVPLNIPPLTECVKHYLYLLTHDDLEVRKASLLLVNAGMHHNTDIMQPYLSDRVSKVLFETLDTKRIKTVDLGPFKHTIDEYLPLRKAALTCIETIFDTSIESLDTASLVSRLPKLLGDKDEIKLQIHQIIMKVVAHLPSTVLSVIESLVQPLESVILKKIKQDAMGSSDFDRSCELVRSTMRTIVCLSYIEDVAFCRNFSVMIEKINKVRRSTKSSFTGPDEELHILHFIPQLWEDLVDRIKQNKAI